MGKKPKKKRRTVADAAALYERGMDPYLDEHNPTAGLKYLLKAARAGYQKAYGEIGIILYREENETDKAEEWFNKAEKAQALSPAAAHEYGMLFYLEKLDGATGLKYLLQSAEQGCESAFGDLGSVLYLERNSIDEAVGWFERAEKAGCLFAPAACHYGLLLAEEKGEWARAIGYLRMAAEDEYEPAFGELGSALYLEEGEIDEAEEWFEKAEEAGCLETPDAYNYGMLLIQERSDVEKGNRYVDMATRDGY